MSKILVFEQICPKMIHSAQNINAKNLVFLNLNKINPKCLILCQTWSIYVEIVLDFDMSLA